MEEPKECRTQRRPNKKRHMPSAAATPSQAATDMWTNPSMRVEGCKSSEQERDRDIMVSVLAFDKGNEFDNLEMNELDPEDSPHHSPPHNQQHCTHVQPEDTNNEASPISLERQRLLISMFYEEVLGIPPPKVWQGECGTISSIM